MEIRNQADSSAPVSRCLFHDRPARAGARIVRSTCGTTLLEFALVLPMFVLLLFAVLDFARLF